MKVAGDWITRTETRAVIDMLARGGHRALFVGGCVRDAVIGTEVGDIDIATDARPDRVMALATAAGLAPVPTGIDHGTVTVVSGGHPHEVTTFRRDVETHGRHATVAWSDDVAEDAARRDFTMNALYAEADGTVIDPVGGMPDLFARRVRFVGDPAARIEEDYLRILRFFRFHARFGDPSAGPDAQGLQACADRADGIGRLSRERVGAEMRKLLAAPNPAPAVAAMAETGVLEHVLPGARPEVLAALVALEADPAPDWLRRLAALDTADATDRLRLSRAAARRLDLLRRETVGDRAPAELAYRHGLAVAADVVLLRAARTGTAPPDGCRAAIARGAAAQFPVSADDLIPAFSGPALGKRLAALESRWIASDFRLTRAELLG